jgi:hypothetical protein
MTTITTEEFWTEFIPAIATFELEIEEGNKAAAEVARNKLVTIVIEMIGDPEGAAKVVEVNAMKLTDKLRRIKN